PLAGSTQAFTFTVEDAGTSYRMCLHDSGGFRPFSLSWSAGEPVPDNWDSSDCGWTLTDAGNGQVRLKSVWLTDKNFGYGYLRCDSYAECVFNVGDDNTQ